jgi:hypothetical protein
MTAETYTIERHSVELAEVHEDGGNGLQQKLERNHDAPATNAMIPTEATLWKPNKETKLAILSLCLVVFIISLDMTIFTVTLPVSD